MTRIKDLIEPAVLVIEGLVFSQLLYILAKRCADKAQRGYFSDVEVILTYAASMIEQIERKAENERGKTL